MSQHRYAGYGPFNGEPVNIGDRVLLQPVRLARPCKGPGFNGDPILHQAGKEIARFELGKPPGHYSSAGDVSTGTRKGK